jgi:hypothetical protein
VEGKNEAKIETLNFLDSVSAIANKEVERQQIESEIEAFLASGGKIDTIAHNVISDPPKKPESNYGSQPI